MQATDSAPAAKAAPEAKDELVKTRHSVIIDGIKVDYTAICGTIVLKEEAESTGDKPGEFQGDKPKATVFFIAYLREGVEAAAARPITFSFNGGPGSSSVWLHLGVLGPRRVEMGDAGALLPPPYRWVENAHSLLDVTDLVFIDPVGTGFSRPAMGESSKHFHSVSKDVESVGDFIRLFCTRYQRWLAPKYLIGESYGTTRAAGLSGYLQERHGLYLNGIMLVSAVLDFATLSFSPDNVLPFILYLPAYTATAWYHRRLPADLQGDLAAALRQAEAFALGDYARALMLGSRLPGAERARVAAQVARFTGLSTDYVARANLRVEDGRFFKELLRAEGRTVGRLDSRFTGRDRDHAGESIEADPSYAAILGPYTAAFNDYVRRDLRFESDRAYEVLSMKVSSQWRFERENQYVSVSDTLRRAMADNPALRVFVANGYYDLATPYFATEHTFSQLQLDDALRANISMAYYEAGHMMYVHPPSLAKMKADLAAFLLGFE